MRLCTAHGSTPLNAYSVHVVGASGDEGTEFVTVDGLARPEAEMPGQPVDFGHVDAQLDVSEKDGENQSVVPDAKDWPDE